MACWLRVLRPRGRRPVDADSVLAFHRLPGHELDLDAHSTLFTGEQSNSSVVFGEDSLLKVFRKVTPGSTPTSRSTRCSPGPAPTTSPRSTAGWTSSTSESDAVHPAGDAAAVPAHRQRRLGARAQASVRNLFAEADLHADEVGGDFAAEAARLGVALAEIHDTLAEHFPTGTRASAEHGPARRRR